MTVYTDKLSGINAAANRVVEFKTDDVRVIASWYEAIEDMSPTFPDMYAKTRDSILRSCNLTNRVMEFVLPLKTVETVLYWAELARIEKTGNDEDLRILAYLKDVLTNEHIKKKKEAAQKQREEAAKAQQVVEEQVSTQDQLDDIGNVEKKADTVAGDS